MRFYAEREFISNKIALHLVDETGRIPAVARPVLMSPVANGERQNPMVRLTANEAQQLMDELWNAGLRPSQGTGSAGALAATERHLTDMRTLVFKGA